MNTLKEEMPLLLREKCGDDFGKRTGFDFDVELTENEMRELAREFLNY